MALAGNEFPDYLRLSNYKNAKFNEVEDRISGCHTLKKWRRAEEVRVLFLIIKSMCVAKKAKKYKAESKQMRNKNNTK
jgi:hypothetical protein